MQVRFIASASASHTRLMTNSPVVVMLTALSFNPPSGRSISPSTTVGGSEPIMLKKLYGAALWIPSAERLVTQAIGRGVIDEASSL